MPRYKLTVAYDGTAFHGWQKQEPPDAEPLRTVQQVLEQAVGRVCRQPVILSGASRTDSGVHARGQVASFNCEQEIAGDRMARAITARLPDDVQVWHAQTVHDAFDPISDCTSKAYQYTLAFGHSNAAMAPLFDRHFVAWTGYELDAVRMHEAAQYLIGEHDFTSMARLDHGRESAVRTVHDCRVRLSSPHRCVIDIEGSGFLHNMVRIIAGTLVEIGRGRQRPEEMKEIIAARDRRAAGQTMPPQGLCLMWVRYPHEGAS